MSKIKKKAKVKSKTSASIFSSSTIRKVYVSYKKNQQQKKIKEIKLKKLQEI